MKVQFTRNIGKKDTLSREVNPESPEYPCKSDGTCYREGEVADLKADAAAKLMEIGLCVEVEVKEAKK